jgi:hypothetical protein
MTAKWGARRIADTYLNAGMTSKEIIKAAKERRDAICASLPDRKGDDQDACKWAKKEAKHYVIFLDEDDRIYSLVVLGQIRQSVVDDLNELGTYFKFTRFAYSALGIPTNQLTG